MEREISELIEIGRELHSRGWLPASGGNLSARLEDGLILITASGSHKGHLTREDFVFVDLEGNLVKGSKRPSAETLLHTLVNKLYPSAMCVLHVHSINSTLISRLSKGDIRLENYELLKAFEGIKTHQTSLRVPPSLSLYSILTAFLTHTQTKTQRLQALCRLLLCFCPM